MTTIIIISQPTKPPAPPSPPAAQDAGVESVAASYRGVPVVVQSADMNDIPGSDFRSARERAADYNSALRALNEALDSGATVRVIDA